MKSNATKLYGEALDVNSKKQEFSLQSTSLIGKYSDIQITGIGSSLEEAKNKDNSLQNRNPSFGSDEAKGSEIELKFSSSNEEL